MLLLDFGDLLDFQSNDSAIVSVGAMTIGIRNVFWIATDNEQPITDAETVNKELFNGNVRQRAIGAALEAVDATPDGVWITFRFDNGFALKVDRTNMWKTDMDLIEVTLPDGRYVWLTPRGELEVADEIEPIRAERWRAGLN